MTCLQITIPEFDTLSHRYPFDFILLSIHQVEDREFWTQDFQKGRTQQEYNERYYEEMLRVVKACQNYSALGQRSPGWPSAWAA